MESNFEFLKKYWSELYEAGRMAESHVYNDPNASVFKMGVLAENLTKRIFQYERMDLPEDDSQANLINILRNEDLLPETIDKILYSIRKGRNEAAHHNLQSTEKAKELLKQTYYLCNWFMKVYGDYSHTTKPYVEPKKTEETPIDISTVLEEQNRKLQELTERLDYVQTQVSERNSEQREEVAEETAKEIEELSKEDETQDIVDISVDYLDVINCAMQQNGAKIINSVTIKNLSDRAIENIVLEIGSDPEFTSKYSFTIENLGEKENIILKNIDIKLNVSYLLNLTEKVGSYLNIRVLSDDVTLCEKYYKVDLLAYDQWTGSKTPLELLCAFITPNHPEVARITSDAAEILMSWGEDPSFNGYQSNDKNVVLRQVAAIYAAIQKLGIVYSEVPASFEKHGQRIRLIETIIQQKFGTCMDLTLLFATCLESVGLNPILLLENGHIFVGVWLEEDTFPDTVFDDSSMVEKRYADGINDIAVFECTSVCLGKNISFNEAQTIAKQEITVRNAVKYVIDVKCCRINGVTPLPIRINDNGTWIIKHEDTKDGGRPAQKPDQINTVDLESSSNTSSSRKTQWERKLLDLGLRNSLINLHMKRRSIVPLLSGPILSELEDELSSGKLFEIMSCPAQWQGERGKGPFESYSGSYGYDDFYLKELEKKRIYTSLEEGELNTNLKNLYRSAKTSLEENGANTLFIAVGLLKWYDTSTSSQAYYAPLILLPVDLVKRPGTGYFVSLREEDAQINITIAEKLSQDFNINIEGLDGGLPEDESGIDIRKIFAIFNKSIMKQPRWSVLESAYLGIFSFSQFVMWNDIHSRSDDLEKNKIVKSLLENKLMWDAEDMSFDGDISEDDSYITLPVDASQLYAIKESVKDKSFVLHGPPGTGKSQTITALIANALAHDKTVLFVAEKRAALEVVEKRLDDIGIGPFCIEMHSNKAKKSDVLDQFKNVLEIGKRKSDENYEQKLSQIASLKKELDIYGKELHKRRSCNYSIFELVNEYERNVQYRFLSDVNYGSDNSFTREKISDQIIEIQKLIDSANLVGNVAENPLRPVRRTEFSQSIVFEGGKLIDKYTKDLRELMNKANDLSEALSLDKDLKSYDGYVRFKEIANSLLRLVNVPQKWARTQQKSIYFEKVREMASSFQKSIDLHDDLSQRWNDRFFEINPNTYLDEYNLNETKWFIPRALGKNRIAKALTVYSLSKVDKTGMQADLYKLIDYNKESESAKAAFAEIGDDLEYLFKGKDTDWKKIESYSYEIQDTIRSVDETLAKDRNLRIEYAGNEQNATVYADYIYTFNCLEQSKKELFEYFTAVDESEGKEWASDQITVWNNVKSALSEIRNWTLWNKHCEEAQNCDLSAVIESLYDGFRTEEILGSYKRTVYYNLASKEIEGVKVLKEFSGELFDGRVKQFIELDNNLKVLNQRQVYYKLASKVPNITSYASQGSEMGLLQKAINNKGRGTSLRKLFERIPNLIEKLAPCMLMSPLSAAQYLDPKRKPFDLVIFDEASQLQTCKAVGAIARGQNAIIVGDPKQMPPTSFFMTKFEEEEDSDYEDAESILDDCRNLSMPQTKLLWHYRSHHESLIAFSNGEFYDNELYTFPSVNDRESKVSFVKVNGTYNRKGGNKRTNLAEANAIVKEIKRRYNDPILSKQSIGVVTFNINQQNLIEDLLDIEFEKDKGFDEWRAAAKEPIFVKNLENVQGDERDVILFSICYGPDEEGNISMNFGPLNREGGYRRLNVAVSRARDEMKVFSSITAANIDTSRTSAQGVIALKHFLEYAATGILSVPYTKKRSEKYKYLSVIDSIAERLGNYGYKCDKLVGHSEYKVDIAVVDPEDEDRYILGIELDGANYIDARTTRDREVGQISVLKGLGWNVIRVWTMDWWFESDKVIKKILDRIKEIQNNSNDPGGGDPVDPPLPTEPPVITVAPISIGDLKKKYAYDYRPFKKRNRYQYDPGDFPYIPANSMINAIGTVIESESPITESLLCKRLVYYFGASRVTDNVRKTVKYYRGKFLNTKGNGEIVYWKNKNQINEFKKFRLFSDSEERIDFADIPLAEIENAVCGLLKLNFAMPKADLIRETPRLIGYERTGQIIKSRVEQAIQLCVENGMVEFGSNDCYVLTDKGSQTFFIETTELKQKPGQNRNTSTTTTTGSRPVVQLDDSNRLIKTYGSVIEAAQAVGIDKKGIWSVANGEQKHAAGYKWMYKDEYDKLNKQTNGETGSKTKEYDINSVLNQIYLALRNSKDGMTVSELAFWTSTSEVLIKSIITDKYKDRFVLFRDGHWKLKTENEEPQNNNTGKPTDKRVNRTDVLIGLFQDYGFEVIDNRMYGSIYVIYDENKTDVFKQIAESQGRSYTFEFRGTRATNSRKAWRIITA